MKQLTGLDQTVKDHRGKEVPFSETDPHPFKVKEALAALISGVRQDSARDSFRVARVAEKIYAAGDTLEVEDYDWTLLKKAVESPQNTSAPFVTAACMTALGLNGE